MIFIVLEPELVLAMSFLLGFLRDVHSQNHEYPMQESRDTQNYKQMFNALSDVQLLFLVFLIHKPTAKPEKEDSLEEHSYEG